MPILSLGVARRHVRLAFAGPDQMDDLVASRVQELRDQAPVAAPPRRLGAHEARRRFGERRRERFLPADGAHARRVAAKRRRPDAREALLARLSAETAA